MLWVGLASFLGSTGRFSNNAEWQKKNRNEDKRLCSFVNGQLFLMALLITK